MAKSQLIPRLVPDPKLVPPATKQEGRNMLPSPIIQMNPQKLARLMQLKLSISRTKRTPLKIYSKIMMMLQTPYFVAQNGPIWRCTHVISCWKHLTTKQIKNIPSQRTSRRLGIIQIQSNAKNGAKPFERNSGTWFDEEYGKKWEERTYLKEDNALNANGSSKSSEMKCSELVWWHVDTHKFQEWISANILHQS